VCREDRESPEDETQRLFETLGDAATVSIKIGRIAGATINEGLRQQWFRVEVSQRLSREWNNCDLEYWRSGNASGKCPRGKEKCGIPQGGTLPVGAMTFGGKWQGSDFEGNKKVESI
jgi:hypothetical protein